MGYGGGAQELGGGGGGKSAQWLEQGKKTHRGSKSVVPVEIRMRFSCKHYGMGSGGLNLRSAFPESNWLHHMFLGKNVYLTKRPMDKQRDPKV